MLTRKRKSFLDFNIPLLATLLLVGSQLCSAGSITLSCIPAPCPSAIYPNASVIIAGFWAPTEPNTFLQSAALSYTLTYPSANGQPAVLSYSGDFQDANSTIAILVISPLQQLNLTSPPLVQGELSSRILVRERYLHDHSFAGGLSMNGISLLVLGANDTMSPVAKTVTATLTASSTSTGTSTPTQPPPGREDMIANGVTGNVLVGTAASLGVMAVVTTGVLLLIL